MMTAARPMTMVPMPLLMSALPLVWANSAPPRAMRALERAMPRTIILEVGTPWARAMRALMPVARTARPVLVLKNQSSRSFAAMTKNRMMSG